MSSQWLAAILVCCLGNAIPDSLWTAEVSRISIEITSKGETTITLSRVPDAEFEKPEGKQIAIFGVPQAEVFDDDGFTVITHHFESPESATALGNNLRVSEGILVTDTSKDKDQIGPKALVTYPRQFKQPLTIEVDVIRHGTIAKSSPSQAGRSLNFNISFAGPNGRGHFFFSLQPTDTKYNSGFAYATWSADGGPAKELGKANIKDGAGQYRFSLRPFPEDSAAKWWIAARGDNAYLRRLRCAGPLAPSFGLELTGKAGQVEVKKVHEDGPAAEAGLMEGDRITHVGEERVRDAPSVLEMLAAVKLADKIELTVRQGESSRKIVLTAK